MKRNTIFICIAALVWMTTACASPVDLEDSAQGTNSIFSAPFEEESAGFAVSNDLRETSSGSSQETPVASSALPLSSGQTSKTTTSSAASAVSTGRPVSQVGSRPYEPDDRTPVSSSPASSSPVQQPSSSKPSPSWMPEEQKAKAVASLVNEERKKEGLQELAFTAELSLNASVRANEIVQSFAHDRPDGSKFSTAVTVPWMTVGENIASGYQTPEEVMKGWMNSPGHKENILKSSFTKIGVGVQENGGRLYWVQLFIG